MIHRIIISHRQTECLAKFPYAPNTIVVFDDPTELDLKECTRLGYSYTISTQSGNRGTNRNTGLYSILKSSSLPDGDLVEFLDGDRFPISYNESRIWDLVTNHGIDCILYTCNEADARLRRISIPEGHTSIVDTGVMCNPFYSCGFIMKVSTIHKIMNFNDGNFFEPRFKGWGCEDQYMGLVCHKLGLKVALTREILLNGRVGGDANDHIDYKDSLQTYVNLIVEKGIEPRHEPATPILCENSK